MRSAIAPAPARLMLIAFAAACLLHADRLPAWCTITASCGLLWHWLHVAGRLALPGRWARLVLTAVLLAGVLASFGTLNGLTAGSTLLICMGAAKLLETRAPRDAVVVTMVALILVLAAGLDRQDLLRVPLYLATGWLALATIAAQGSRWAAASTRRALRQSGMTMLLAVPFAVLAFVLVPRLPGALWSLPGGDTAQTGLSDEMSPGSISDLAISDTIAFRVRFEGEVPSSGERYWRGPVLHEFDGFTWRGLRSAGGAPRQQEEYLSAPIRYQVMLEPHGQPYLFTLDAAREVTGHLHRRSFDGQFLSNRPVTATLVYQAVSHLQWRNPDALSLLGRRLDTRLPAGRNPRSMALAQTLRGQSANDADYAQRVMQYFATGGFEYSLTPPLLNLDSVDDLLFNTRLGFCGHFASAYATLMRAAGVPARVVTGYLGGSWNPVGGYFMVRQSEAHAWVEAWLDGQGWVRFDPTSMVAPERLQRGLSELLPGARSAADALVQRTGWLRTLRDGWDAAGSVWQERIVRFNAARQRDLLGSLGLGQLDYRGMAALLLAGALLWGGLLVLLARWRSRPVPADALARLWGDFLELLARHGVVFASHEGPEAIRRRARQQFPHASAAIESFCHGYLAARFGRPDTAASDPGALRDALRTVQRALAT